MKFTAPRKKKWQEMKGLKRRETCLDTRYIYNFHKREMNFCLELKLALAYVALKRNEWSYERHINGVN